ncbi:cation transporter [Halobacillus sp. ACCC02827]|uniref:cation transporter n=1 Tax=Bacillaceae TaxID=186817 RepID=UPI0002A520D1|nr:MULTISPECIES: cation transporter [Bacillaceae]ELK47006.1 copper chaperone CopZ [Halobacillus sp. BAB-2008]QHT47556.1 heavy-metal-associated domain-containing protein [Bacillus sp. SB49]WJE14786.1 cation transporter [Halobacillus sp. ACCC02827]
MELTLEVNGMSCEKCRESVKDALQTLEGVHGVEVLLESGKVHIAYDEAYVSKGLMKEAVRAQGYEAVG